MSQHDCSSAMRPASRRKRPDRAAAEGRAEEEEAKLFVASQWQLMWWRFRRHKLAMIAGVVVIFIYVVALFAEFFAPFPPDQYARQVHLRAAAAPALLRQQRRRHAAWHVRLWLQGRPSTRSRLRRVFVDRSRRRRYPVTFFAHGVPYKLLGVIPDRYPPARSGQRGATRCTCSGADSLGRDMFSRMIYGTRISMSIGLVGVAISLILGILLGGISGYFGGTVDNVIQR